MPLPLFVVDTHALLWLLSDPSKLGAAAAACLVDVVDGRARAVVSAITFVECRYLEERQRIDEHLTDAAIAFVERVPTFATASVDLDVARALAKVPRDQVPDMPDRIIAATAIAMGASLLTVDAKVTAWGGVPIVWK